MRLLQQLQKLINSEFPKNSDAALAEEVPVDLYIHILRQALKRQQVFLVSVGDLPLSNKQADFWQQSLYEVNEALSITADAEKVLEEVENW